MKTINLRRLERVKDLDKFYEAFKESLERMRRDFALDTFCRDGGDPTDPDFYQIEMKRFDDDKAVGVIHLSFIERLKPTSETGRCEKHHHVRFGFKLNRESGNLQLGKGFLRT